MKKTNLLVLSAAAALLATSCSKDQVSEVNPGNAIRFKSFVDASSKAPETGTADVQDFKVFAFTGLQGTGFTHYYTDTYVSNGPGAGFTSEGGTHYWPADQTLNCVFTGYSPADLTSYFNSPLSEDVTNPAVAANRTISGIEPKQNAADQLDLLVFRSFGTGQSNSTSGVTLEMHHAMSQIQVKAVNSDPSITIKVKGVKVIAKNKANLALPDNATSANSPISQNHWTMADGAIYSSYLAMSDETQMSNNAGQPTDLTATSGGFMLIPQTLTSWTGTGTAPADGISAADGAYIAVLCQISQGGTQLYPTAADTFGYTAVALPESSNWEPGKKYVYTLKFFDNGGGGGIQPPIDPTDPDNPDPENPGNPVLGNPIKLTVNVSGWTNGTGAGDVTVPAGTN